MRENILIKILLTQLTLLLVITFSSCSDDTTGPNSSESSVGGTITYVDSYFNFNGGYYAVSIFPDTVNPLNHQPIAIDSVEVNVPNKSAYFKITSVAQGYYFVASIWINSSNHTYILLGEYGCDINPNCPTAMKITVPNSAGNGATNFQSRTH